MGHDGRRNRTVEELDFESFDVESHGGMNFARLQVQSPRRVQAKNGLRGDSSGVKHPP